MFSPRTPRLLPLIALFLTLGCTRAPDELAPPPASSTPAGPAVAPLTYAAPGTWTLVESHERGDRRATYKTPKAAADKEEPELSVWFYGTGSKGDPKPHVEEWLRFFDGDPTHDAKHEDVTENGVAMELVEISGTYKMPIGPPVGPNKKTPMQMVKEGYAMLIGVVKTKDRGNWFFRLIGPKDSVESAKSGFRTMLSESK